MIHKIVFSTVKYVHKNLRIVQFGGKHREGGKKRNFMNQLYC